MNNRCRVCRSDNLEKTINEDYKRYVYACLDCGAEWYGERVEEVKQHEQELDPSLITTYHE